MNFREIHTKKLVLLENSELQREASRRLVYQISDKLLDLTILGKLLPLWDKADFDCYHHNTRTVIAALEDLKKFYPAHEQCSRIDSVSLLLVEKKIQLSKLYESFGIRGTSQLNHSRISAIHTNSLKRKNQELNNRLGCIVLLVSII